MKSKSHIYLLLLLQIFHIGNGFAQEDIQDIDGNVYPTVKIGSQLWMAKNLAVSHYHNGDTIISYCYNHDIDNCVSHGRLYPWRSIVGGMELDSLLEVCPKNWHIPSDEEWTILLDIMGGPNYAAEKLRRESDTNFCFQYGGNYQTKLDIFSFFDRKTYFWTSTKFSSTAAWMYMTSINTRNINRTTVPIEFSFSVRCIRDY